MTGHHAKLARIGAKQLRAAGCGVLMREPVKAVPSQAEALRPGLRHSVGSSFGRQPGVERGIEAGDRRHARHRGRGRLDAGQCPRLVQRCQVGQLGDSRRDRVVEHRRPGVAAAAVHDPVTDRVGAGLAAQEVTEITVAWTAVPRIEVKPGGDLVSRAKHADLETARSGIDDQDACHRHRTSYGRRRACRAGSCHWDRVTRTFDSAAEAAQRRR